MASLAMPEGASVFVVDDDAECRRSIDAMVRSMGLRVETFLSAEQFLTGYRSQAGCLVVGQRLSGASGVELLEELHRQERSLPSVLLLGTPNTRVTVRAMKSGTLTVLDKPCDDNELWQAIRDGLALDGERRQAAAKREDVQRRMASLTPSERTVLEMILAGKANKTIAAALETSLRTVESRRRGVFTKLGVQTVAELVGLVLKAE